MLMNLGGNLKYKFQILSGYWGLLLLSVPFLFQTFLFVINLDGFSLSYHKKKNANHYQIKYKKTWSISA